MDDLELVEHALTRAATKSDLVKAAAALAFEIAHCQGFYEGNKRTAFVLAQEFWHENAPPELRDVFAGDDDEIRELIVRAARGETVEAQIAEALSRRIQV